MKNLVSAKDFLNVKRPFWPEEWYSVLPDGAKMLMVPPQVEMEKPIELLVTANDQYFVAIGSGAKVTIREVADTKNDESWNCNVKLFLDESAHVNYVVDEMISRSEGCTKREAVIADNAVINWYGALIKQNNYETSAKTFLKGPQAVSNYYWACFVDNQEKVDLNLANNFDAKNCRGEIMIKTIANKQARVTVIGGIEITLNGGGTDSYLKEDSLMLDKRARVRALPCLEIKTNDVKAGHGATVTNVSAEQLFYLQAHGLDQLTAREMFVQGFLSAILVNCPDEEVRQKFLELTTV